MPSPRVALAALCAALVAWALVGLIVVAPRHLHDLDAADGVAAYWWSRVAGGLPPGQKPRLLRPSETPCARVTVDEFVSSARNRPMLIADAQPELASGSWADPVESPLARFGAEQRVRAYVSPGYIFKSAGFSMQRQIAGPGRAVMRWPAEAWVTLASAIHLATRRRSERDHGCCLKLQNIPFVEGDSLLPQPLLRVVDGGRDASALREGEDLYLPQIWAHQAGVVTPLHHDEFNSVILQLAGTRVATLFAPERERELLVDARLPIEQVVLPQRYADADLTSFPRASSYRVVDCTAAPANCPSSRATMTSEGLDENVIFSSLELAEPTAPRADMTCALAPGDALFIPKWWFHRFDDDPRDAATDLFQVSVAYWFYRAREGEGEGYTGRRRY